MSFIAPIVEGTGERLAVEKLLWRVAQHVAPGSVPRINPPIRVKSGSFFNDAHERRRHVLLAAGKARPHQGHVLVLLDCDDGCPAERGPRLLADVSSVAADVPCTVVLAHREYETWFMAAVESLRGVEGLDPNAVAPADPEATRNAKGWLSRLMPNGYDPVTHQMVFTQRFDLEAARRVVSFDRLCRKVASMMVGEGS